MADPNTIEAEVAALGDLTLSALRERWRELFGNPPPKSLRRAFLVKACAHQIQVRAYGGLSGRTRRRLRRIAEDPSAGKPVAIAAPRRIKPGTRLVRAWGGSVHVVTVVAGGFEYAGKRYGSLSAIAKAITGSNWNAPAFFGLERPAGATQGPQRPVRAPRAAVDGGAAASTGAEAPGARAKELEVVGYELVGRRRFAPQSIRASPPTRAWSKSSTASTPNARPAKPMSSARSGGNSPSSSRCWSAMA